MLYNFRFKNKEDGDHIQLVIVGLAWLVLACRLRKFKQVTAANRFGCQFWKQVV